MRCLLFSIPRVLQRGFQGLPLSSEEGTRENASTTAKARIWPWLPYLPQALDSGCIISQDTSVVSKGHVLLLVLRFLLICIPCILRRGRVTFRSQVDLSKAVRLTRALVGFESSNSQNYVIPRTLTCKVRRLEGRRDQVFWWA